MADRSKNEKGYNTNLASEFYVLSMLYRLGFNANLTLGNKKSVDITVVLGPGRVVTVDVKAVAGKMDWLMGSRASEPLAGHFVVLVSFEGRFSDPAQAPVCWIIPDAELASMIKTAKGKSGMRYLSRKRVVDELQVYKGAWRLLASS